MALQFSRRTHFSSGTRRAGAVDCRATVLPVKSSVQVSLSEARDTAELRAAAYLRAYSFYTYPADRSQFSARAHRRMKGDAEWGALQAKLAGKEVGYEDVAVNCFIATIPDDPDCPVVKQIWEDMDLSAKLPSVGPLPPRIVVGTLDVNRGAVLPAEELIGKLPVEGGRLHRAYFSNVCVSPAMRRQGVAQALMQHGELFAREQGVQHMYVHVVHDNTAAVQLYTQQLGFEVEAEESEGVARSLQRPRRLLLHKSLM